MGDPCAEPRSPAALSWGLAGSGLTQVSRCSNWGTCEWGRQEEGQTEQGRASPSLGSDGMSSSRLGIAELRAIRLHVVSESGLESFAWDALQ